VASAVRRPRRAEALRPAVAAPVYRRCEAFEEAPMKNNRMRAAAAWLASLMTMAAPAWFALPAAADVVIRLRDGSVHRVPVNPQDVTGIEFVPGAGASAAIPAHAGQPWVVNNAGNILRGDARGWQSLPGAARDIGVGADGSAWVVGANSVPGGFGIYRWAGSAWVPVDGGAARITVDPRGEPWIVTAEGRIFQRRGAAWRELPGRATDIGAGANGEVWVTGVDNVPGGHSVFRWNGADWTQIEGAGVRIAVGPDGSPWVVNADGHIYQRQGGRWVELPGRARDIAIGAGGTPWIIGTDAAAGGHSMHFWNGSAWVRVEGGAVGIAVR
jgi:hypothetical protein